MGDLTAPDPARRPSDLPPTNADGARMAARARDEAIAAILTELREPLAALIRDTGLRSVARDVTAEAWTGGGLTLAVARSATQAGREEVIAMLDEEIRLAHSAIRATPDDAEEIDAQRCELNCMQSFRYRVTGQSLNLDDPATPRDPSH